MRSRMAVAGLTAAMGAACLLAWAAPVAQTAGGGAPGGAVPENRWFFCFGYRPNRADVDEIKSLVRTAADHGLNGMVLSSVGLDSITRWPQERFALLAEIEALCKEKGIELIPTGFSVGYGGGALGYDPNFAAALPVTIALRAEGGRAVPVAGPNLLVNGDLEEHQGDRFPGYAYHDQPGTVSFADTTASSSGRTSIRMENFTANPHGHGRIMQKVAVQPGHAYRFTVKMKTEGLGPVSGVQLLALSGKNTLASACPPVQPTQDWTEATLDFITRDQTEVNVYAGIWGGKTGRFWLDDLQVREYCSLADIVRRDGTPLALRSADRQAAFVEGVDFAKLENRRSLEAIRLTPGSSIREGERLLLDCYKTPFIGQEWGRQISLCMSNPALYEYWEAQARRLHEVLPFKKFLLEMDEIRNGGGCLLCRNSGKTMAQILGDCITRQRAIFKAIDPEIEVLIWSDMLDPNHNAHDNYYGVVGDFTGSYQYVPKDLVIMCWWNQMKETSLAFFSGEGFRTIGACYYDADDLTNSREWLDLLRRTPGAQGIMFTSWQKKYGLLGAYGGLVSGQ
jgi:hypothetical protein